MSNNRGERRLDVLLAGMNPTLHKGTYAFCVADAPVPQAVATVTEGEGLTVVVDTQLATALGLTPLFVADWITLMVHSDLHAVGFLAAVTSRLADAGISCNVISAVHHDHLFVPEGRGEEAVALLRS